MTAPEQTPPLLDPDVLEQLDAAATPGPWWAWDRGVGWMLALGAPVDIDEHGRPREYLPEGIAEGTLTEPDAKLIAALRNAAPEMTRLADDRENIHTRLLDVLEQTGWIEPDWRDRFDPLAAAVFTADALVQSTNAKQAVMYESNATLGRLRDLLLAALDVEDDGRTGLDEYIRRLAAQRDETVRDRDGARDALRRVQDRYHTARAEPERLRDVLREVLALYDGCEPNGLVLPDFVPAATVACWRDALGPDAPECPGDPYCRFGHRCPAHRDADGVVAEVLLDATDASADARATTAGGEQR